jgi:hypothetical protein
MESEKRIERTIGLVLLAVLGLFLRPTLLAVGYELIREWSAVETADVQLDTSG